MKSRSTLLLQRALYLLERDPVWGLEVDLIDRNVHAWRVTMSGLEDSEWAGAQLIVDLQFPDSFDLDPPVVKFLTVPYHPNVRPNDGVLVCALLQFWASGTDISMLLVAIQHLLSEPIVNDPCPANYAAAKLYTKDRAGYFSRVREMAYAAPIALQQLRLEAHFAHATQVFQHTFADESPLSGSNTRPSSSPPKATTKLVQPTITAALQGAQVVPKRQHPRRARVRKLQFEHYYSDWQSLATTAPGNNCRVEFSSVVVTPNGVAQSPQGTMMPSSPSPDVLMSRIPTGNQVASIVGSHKNNQVLVNLKDGMTPRALAMHVAREDAVRASRQEHLLRYGSLATTIPPPVPDGDPSTGRVWLVPQDTLSSSNARSRNTSPTHLHSNSPNNALSMTFMVVGGPPVTTANAVSLGLPSSGGGCSQSLLDQHFLHADHHNKDPSYRVRDRIAGRPKRQAQPTFAARHDLSPTQFGDSSRPSSGGSDSTRTYTRGPSALDRWTPSPVQAKARGVPVKVIHEMPLVDELGNTNGSDHDKETKPAMPPLPVLVTPGDGGEDDLGIQVNKLDASLQAGDDVDDELQLLSWAKDLALDVM